MGMLCVCKTENAAHIDVIFCNCPHYQLLLCKTYMTTTKFCTNEPVAKMIVYHSTLSEELHFDDLNVQLSVVMRSPFLLSTPSLRASFSQLNLS